MNFNYFYYYNGTTSRPCGISLLLLYVGLNFLICVHNLKQNGNQAFNFAKL